MELVGVALCGTPTADLIISYLPGWGILSTHIVPSSRAGHFQIFSL